MMVAEIDLKMVKVHKAVEIGVSLTTLYPSTVLSKILVRKFGKSIFVYTHRKVIQLK